MTALSAAGDEPSADGELADRLVAEYRSWVGELPGVDELVTPTGTRTASADLAATVDLLGRPGLLARRAQTARLVQDDGVTYGLPHRSTDGTPIGAVPARYRLDPLPVVLDAQEWQGLQAAIGQRLELLDLLLSDLYGPRDLLRRKVIPPEVVFGHTEFLRAADQIRLPGPRQLFLAAVDLGRDAAGRWVVIADRTQAPSGAGYAMENRRIVSRVMPALYRDARLERLRAFFHTVRAGLQEVAPATAEVPRVVILTPGPGSETAFDQSFLATVLGYPLVSGQDLVVRGGRVHMKALGRLEPVDVVLRRVDAGFADPLELRPDSRLGVPGLIEAARAGTVSVVNTFGSGVLENPGLLPFLDRAAELLLGESLQIPSALTWWCGDPTSRSHVLARLDQLVIKPISRGSGQIGEFGWELSSARREELRRRIEAEPHAWCGQQPVELSSAPVVTAHGLAPRRMILRTFAVAQGGGYRLMTGGLGRVAARPGSTLVSSRVGSPAKDVWVLSPTPSGVSTPAGVQPGLPLGQVTQDVLPPSASLGLPPGVAAPPARVAEDLFWLGRYAERAEDTVRLLRVVDDLAEDWAARPGTAGHHGLQGLLPVLTEVTTTFPGFIGDGAAQRLSAPRAELLALVVDAGRPGTLAHAVGRTVEAAHAVRDQLSLDTWVVLGSLNRVLDELTEASRDGVERPLQPALARMLEGLLGLAGLAAESMVRDVGWYYLDAGRRLERALQVTALLRHTAGRQYPSAVESLVLEAVLIAGESIITHRRRHQGRPQPGAVVELLVADRHNPRSVAYQLDRLAEDLRRLPEPAGPVRAAGSARADGAATLSDRLAAVQALARETVADPGAGQARLHEALSGLADAFRQAHFVHAAPQRSMVGTPRWPQ